MKHFYIAGALALLAATPLGAQSKFDSATLMLLQSRTDAAQTLESTASILSVKAPTAEHKLSFIIEKTPSTSIETIEQTGATVISASDRYAVVEASLDEIELIGMIEGVTGVGANYEHNSKCDLAREATGVNAIHSGAEGLPKAFTGKGVIAAVVDLGIQPNHVNFTDEWQTETRVKRMWHFNSNDGRFTEYSDDDEIYIFTSDNTSETHGTHVAGIMAGSYAEISRYAIVNSKGSVDIKSARSPFKGMAPEADILLSGGALYDANIIGGVNNVMAYAKETGQPYVINLSLGHNHGPHDGTDISTAALDEAGKHGIVCVAAGNEGETPLAVTRTLEEDDNTVITFIKDNSANGIIDIWISNEKPTQTSWIIYDSNAAEIIYRFTADNANPGKATYLGNNSSYTQSEAFNNSFSGYVSMLPSLDPRNNRWHVYCTANVKQKTSGRYWLGLEVKGESGQRVDIYGNEKSTFTNRGFQEFDNGGYDGTINGLACGRNMIVVGSYATRTSLANLSGSLRSMGGKVNALSSFSSWGSLHDGRKLPTVCAPGEWIASSINASYVDNRLLDDVLHVGEATGYSAPTDHWGYLQGTSMATPCAAGIIALWLEAAPSLTTSQVVDIINRTSTRDEFVASNPDAWGAGKINALEGIKEALKIQTSTQIVTGDSNPLVTNMADGRIEVFVAGATSLSATLYNTCGAAVGSAKAAAETAVIDTEGLTPGIYVIAVDTPAGRHSSKVVVK